MLASTVTPFYHARRIHRLLQEWEQLEALAETPMTARGLVGQEREGATPTDPKTQRQKGSHGDALRWADIVADLERGHATLTSGGLGVEVIHYIKQGYSIGQFARLRGRPRDEIIVLYDAALAKLSARLDPVPSS
jgi:hypothetical protein